MKPHRWEGTSRGHLIQPPARSRLWKSGCSDAVEAILVALTGLASVRQCLSWDGEPRAGCSDPAPQILKKGPKTSPQQLPTLSLTDPRAQLAFFAGRTWCCLTFTTLPTRFPRSCSAVPPSGQRTPTCTLSNHLILGCQLLQELS